MLKSLLVGLLLCVPVQAERGWKNSRREAARQVEPVATTKWIGGTSTDWNTAGNWSNGIPGEGDTMLVDSSAGRDLLLNLDRSADDLGDGLKLALLHIHNGCTVDIGSSGSPLKIAASKIINESDDGQLWFSATTGGGAVKSTDRIVHRGASEFSYVENNAPIVQMSILNGSGTLNIASATSYANIYVLSRNPEPIVEITGTGAIEALRCVGGIVEINKSAGAVEILEIDGGEVTNTDGAVTLLSQTRGAYYHDGTDTIAEFIALGGTADFTRTGSAKTITLLRRDPTRHILTRDGSLLTVTSEFNLDDLPD